MNKRLEMLIQLTSSGKGDAFAWYALALEYRKEGRHGEALSTFSRLRERDPSYLPMYLMAGQTAGEAGDAGAARSWLDAGIELARSRGDAKTLGELESELAGLG
jgi:hypothetical protein